MPAEESIDSFNVWSQDGLLSLFVVGEERGRRSACECVRRSPGVPCPVSGSLNSSFSSEMGPGAPLFPWSQRLSALWQRDCRVRPHFGPSLTRLVLNQPNEQGQRVVSRFFSTDPDTFGFVWFGLCSLGEENAWQHWPFKASSAAPRRVLGAGKDSTGTAGKFVSAAQWGAVDFRQWPATSLLYVGDGDAGPTLNSQCTHPMKAERWGSRGSRMLRGVFLETQSLEVSLK